MATAESCRVPLFCESDEERKLCKTKDLYFQEFGRCFLRGNKNNPEIPLKA